MQAYDYCCYTRSIVMKKIIIFIGLLLLVGCTNYNSVEEVTEESANYFCYKKYDNYEAYIEFGYKDNIVENIIYSYVFNKNIKEYKELDKYSEYMKYKDNNIDITFESIDVDLYKEIKNNIIGLYKIEEDNYGYIENNIIKYDLFMNYLEDYSCE